MSGRHRRPNEPHEPRATLARATGAGAAGVVGVAAVLGMSPAAHAAAPHATSHSDAGTSKATANKSAHAAATPDYGYQKFRVGVQLKDGSYAPTPAAPNTMTGGTKFTITETDGVPADTKTFSCTTQDASQDPGTTRTWCLGDVQVGLRTRAAAVAPRLITRPSPADAPPDEFFRLDPGYTATITQTTVRPNLVKDTSTATIEPCVQNYAGFCVVDPSAQQLAVVSTDEIFEDTGLPPQANNDSADTGYQQPTTVDVLGNDVTHGAPVTGLHVTSAPGHGSAHVVSTGSGREIRYRPDSGFVGTDTFTYTLKTANGTSTATVTVHVAAPPPTAHDDSATTGQGQGVDVDVLSNDNTRGQNVTRLRVTSGPKHGGAHVVKTSSGREIRYTPDAGYTGTDTFKYQIRTDGGISEATVTVHVNAPPPAHDTTQNNTGPQLAATGVDPGGLLELGGLLLGAGAMFTAAGRRYRGRA